MSDPLELFRVQFDRLMEEIKRGICLELDTKARALFALLQEELLRQLSTDDQTNQAVTGDDLNESDEIVFCRFQEDGADSVSVKSECECESAQDEDYDIKEEPEEEEDRGEAGDGDNNENNQDEADDHVSQENAEINVDADSESDYDRDDEESSFEGSESDSASEVKEEAIDADQGETEERENLTGTDQVAPIASTSSGLRRSSRKSIKRKDLSPDDAATSDDEDNDRERYGAERQRKKARVDPTAAVRTEANHEDTNGYGDSKQVITRYLNCTVPGCVKKKKDKAKLKKHLKRKHGVYLDRCFVRGCNATFPDRKKIGNHLRSAHGTLTSWPCDICNVQCTSYNTLGTHVRDYHEQGHFACGYTGCRVTSHINRKKVIIHHYQHKPATHQCTFAGCSKVFKKSNHLKNHLVTHTGEKAFNCIICNTAFTEKSSLIRHLKSQTHRRNAERATAAVN